MGDISTALLSTSNAVVQGTTQKQIRAWRRFNQYLTSIGIGNDPYLESFDHGQRHKILCAFAQSIREGRFGSQPPKLLKAKSVRATLDCVAQAYKLADRADPRLDHDGKLAFPLQRQLRGYKSTDPGQKPQVAITGSVLRKFYQLAISDFDKALCTLFMGAVFFAMRSCEYIKVQGTRKTKLLELRNIRFIKGNTVIPHSSPLLSSAECVSITFELQKRDAKDDTITQHRSGDKLLCPVIIWANIVKRIRSYKNSTSSTTVNSYQSANSKKIHSFTGTELLKRLCFATTSIGSNTLGFTAKDVGLHSARSGAAMAMYLAHIPVFTIMLLGCWSSNAFLRYIRKQVKEFSNGISSKMIQHEHFFTIPSTSIEDPRVSNNHLNLACRNKHGHSFKDTVRPLASVFH